MNLLFDEDSQKLIIQAKREMYELKHPYVGSEHLLLAILKKRDLEITKMLDKYDINYNNFRNEIVKVIGVGSKSNNWFLFTPLLRRVINNAMYYADDSNKIVTPYNLLVAILQEGEGVANRILVGMDIDIELLYTNIVNSKPFVLNNKLILDDLAINMNNNSSIGKYDPVIGRDEQVNRVIQVLLRKNKNNPLLVGAAGVGKTAIVEELARKIVSGDVPNRLKNKIIYSISMAVLVAGTKYRGEFEERFNKIIKEVTSNKNIILFIDEIHTLIGAGGAEGAVDASNIVKPYLARGDFQVIGATTDIEYNKTIANDKAIERRFQKITILEPSTEEVINIITELKNVYEKFHNVIIPAELIKEIVILSNKYLCYGKQPDKALDLLDEACAYSYSFNDKRNNKLSIIEKRIKDVENNKNKAILSKSFNDALKFKRYELKLKNDYNELLFNSDFSNMRVELTKEDIYKIVYDKTGILMGDRLRKKLIKAKKELKKTCFGKDKFISEITSFIEENYFKDHLPISFLLIGKSGVGKTFLVEELVKNICSFDSFIKIDLNNCSNSLFSDSFLNKIKLYPFSILLFKNISLCSKDIYDLLLHVLSQGYLTNSTGEKIWFSNTIIFLQKKVLCMKLDLIVLVLIITVIC